MSQPTRAQRRQHGRGGSSDKPPHRDPMMPIYIGAAAIVVIVIAIFGFLNWQHSRQLAEAYATPTPGPSASAKLVPLSDGMAIGTAYFKDKLPDTPQGGHGQPVDGITCMGMEGANLHIHTHLALFYKGKQIMIPALIGASGNPTSPQNACLYWIHTHSGDGIIHVESPEVNAPATGGRYTLGMLFDIWGQPLERNNIAGFKGPVTVYVNGTQYDGDLHSIPLMSHEQITLEVGTPVVPPPNYAFPPAD